MEKTITKERFYAHPIEQVWEAISTEEAISAWFIRADFKAEKGYQYKFTRESTVISGEILEASPVTRLVYTWVVSGTEAVTTVSWNLRSKDGGTVLSIEHTGIENYPDSAIPKMFESFSSGWTSCMDELMKHLNNETKSVSK